MSSWNLLTLALAAFVVFQAVALVALMRETGRLSLRLADFSSGAVIRTVGPVIGSTVSLPDETPLTRNNLVVFLAPGCSPCETLIPILRDVHADFPHVGILAAVKNDDPRAYAEMQSQLGDDLAPVDLSSLFSEWQVTSTPFIVGLNDNGLVRGSGVANNREHLEVILAETAEPPDARARALAVAESNGGSHPD